MADGQDGNVSDFLAITKTEADHEGASPEDHETQVYNFDSFKGILNEGNTKHIAISGGENNRIVDSEVQFINVHHHHANGTNKEEKEMQNQLEDIKQSLETQYSSELAWVTPLPWIPDLVFEPEEFYVDIAFEELSRGGKLSKKESMKMEELLVPDKGNERSPKRILIRGEAGMGKTTLCMKMAYDWAVGKTGNLASGFQLLIMYRLRDLLERESPEKGLVQFCHYNSTREREETFTVSALQRNAANVLLVLDGYDELLGEHRASLQGILRAKLDSFQSVFRNSTIIVTSRSTEDEHFLRLFQRHVRIVGLSEFGRKQIVMNMFPYDEDRSALIITNLEKYTLSFTAKVTPFILYLICYLYQNQDVKELKTPSKVIGDVLLLLGKKCCKRLELSLTDSEMEALFQKLGQYSLKRNHEMTTIFSREDIRQLYQNHDDTKFIFDCGILQPIRSLKRAWRKENWVESVHKLFLDYISSTYLQFQFDSGETLDDKISVILRELKPYSFQFCYAEPNSVRFYTDSNKRTGLQFACTFEEDAENHEVLQRCFEKGRFYFNDDETYLECYKEFKKLRSQPQFGWFEVYLTREPGLPQERPGFPGIQFVLPTWLKGKNFLTRILSNPSIQNEVCLAVVHEEPEKLEDEPEYIVRLLASEEASILWDTRLYFLGSKFCPLEWIPREVMDGISFKVTKCHKVVRPKEQPKPDSTVASGSK